jgi:hypothetical protein
MSTSSAFCWAGPLSRSVSACSPTWSAPEVGLPPSSLAEAELAESAPAAIMLSNVPEPFSLHRGRSGVGIRRRPRPARRRGMRHCRPRLVPQKRGAHPARLVEAGKAPAGRRARGPRAGRHAKASMASARTAAPGCAWPPIRGTSSSSPTASPAPPSPASARLGEPLVPHLMREIEVLDDYKTGIFFHFRKGLRSGPTAIR